MVLVGDSITAQWPPELFEVVFGHRRALNIALAGDTTGGAIWRLRNVHRPSSLKPRFIMLLIGTNNGPVGSTAENTALGIAQLIREIQRRAPGARILLLYLLPRGATPADPLRQTNNRIGALIRPCADGRRVVWADPGAALLDAAGNLPPFVAADLLHPSWVGYGILAGALREPLRAMTGE
jgi:lysophospholipase L1-like esterase